MAKPGAALLKLMGRMAKRSEYNLQLAQVVDASAGGLKVKFLGDEEPTLQYFRQLASGVSLNDWVVCARMGNSWVVLGRWAPEASPSSTGASFWDDFVWDSLPTELYQSARCFRSGGESAAELKAGPGIVYLLTNAVSQHAYIVLKAACVPGRDPLLHVGLLGEETPTSMQAFVGWYSQAWPRPGDPPDTRDWDHAAFWYDSAKSANWWASIGGGGAGNIVEQETDVPMDGGHLADWRDFGIELLSTSHTAKFYVGGALKATLVGDGAFPRSYLALDWVADVFRAAPGGATNKTMLLDYVQLDVVSRGY